MEKEQTGGLWEWIIPFAFVFCMGWAIWHTPAYILDFIPPDSESLRDQMSELHLRKDVTPGMGGLFGGYADVLDWLALVLIPVFFVLGVRGVKVAQMEYQEWSKVDRVALFIGRVTMILIISMTLVMLYEVFLRYAIEAPTLWANELTLWIAGFVFLSSGLYAMQQRCHIRIFLLYDVVPRWMQRTFDTIWALQALRGDAWLHAHGDPTGPEAPAIRAAVRAAFADDDPSWIATLWPRFSDVFGAALRNVGVSARPPTARSTTSSGVISRLKR